MDLKSYLSGLDKKGRQAYAKRCGTTLGHLLNISYGCKPCAPELAIKLDRESNGEVKCDELAPDVDWEYVRTQAATRRESNRSHRRSVS